MYSRFTRRLAVLVSFAVVGATAAYVMPAGAAVSVNLDQCANENAPALCVWQNGNLNGNNSTFSEGDVVPFRLAIEGLGAGQHTIHINYDFTAGGHKAYDFLASYESTENVDLCRSGGGGVSSLCGGTPSEANLPTPLSVSFPSDGFTADTQLVSGAESISGLTRNLTVYGATVGAAPFSAITHTGLTSGNSDADLTFTFTTAGSSSPVLLAWGGHLASSAYWITDDGSANVSGAPWHMRTQNLDNRGAANQDRSIQPSALSGAPEPEALLTVTKIVINDDGGTKAVSDFPLFVSGTSVTSGVANTFAPGTYTVSETGPDDYAGVIGGDCAADGSITLTDSQTKVCTITNDDVAPTLTVIKHVINDNGGTLEADAFTMNVTGTDVSVASFAGSEAGVTVTLDAGTYAVTEAGPDGYAASSSGDCSGTIALGDNLTCTITNDDRTGQLIVIKHVVNDDDGYAHADDFTLTVDRPGSQANASVTGAENPGTTIAVNAGAYSVTETGDFSGYTPSYSAGCTGTLTLGETKTCTVTNNDVAGDYDDPPVEEDDPPAEDDDPGTTDPVVESATDTSGDNATQQPLQPAPVQTPAPLAVIPATDSAPAPSPTAAQELPRTGAGLREETLLALALMLAGLSALGLGRRRNRPADV
jgi:hypothetical protein